MVSPKHLVTDDIISAPLSWESFHAVLRVFVYRHRTVALARMVVHHVPDPLTLQALGLVALRHGQLEYALRGVIKSLTGKGLLVSLDSTFTQRAWSLRKDILDIAEAKLGAGAHLISLGDLIDQAEAVSLRRNKYLHSLYAQELDGDPMLLTEERKGGKGSKIERKREPIPTPDQLNALAREIETLADKLH
jgi:hypothetical protein